MNETENISKEERALRLAEYLDSISGDSQVDEFMEVSKSDMELEGVSTRDVDKSMGAVEQMMRGASMSSEDLYGVEAIIHKTKRPSHKVKKGKFDPFPGDFRYLSEDKTVRKNIRKAFPSIGRIDTPDRSIYGGTGFVVGKNLVMTNRHVAQLFTRGEGRAKVTITLRNSEIDFREAPSNRADGFRLTSCVMVHPYWDMALFTADLPDHEELELSVVPYARLRDQGQDIVVVGYPAKDSQRNAADVQRNIFGNEFEIKRIAPGRVSTQKRQISSRWLGQRAVAALTHDASTLGGNSGSAVINVESGQVAALHFAGRYLVENYAVPCHELARDPRVIEAGVNFDESDGLPSESILLQRYWRDADPEAVRPEGSSRPVVVNMGPRSSQVQGNEMTFEVPLRVTISVEVGDGTTPASRSGGGGGRDGVLSSESTGGGYDPGFLSERVPTPGLSCDLIDDAFIIDQSHLIPYTHFSVCQSKSRTLPRFVAWNIDGANMKTLSRKSIPFIRDRRVPDQFQAGNELYKNNPYDRGHVARRVDLNWGPLAEAKEANRDSFFFTNMAPQHERFNQSRRHGLWGELENAILEDVKVEDLRVSVMAGPIFQDDDPLHRGVGIPRDFWKLVAYRDTDDNQFKVAAYILSQAELIPTEALELDAFNLYKTSLSKLEDVTGLNFDALREFDRFSSDQESVSGSGLSEVLGRGDLTV